MAKPTLKDLVPTDDKPLPRQVQRFITHYVHAGRDLKEAACKADLDPKWGEKLWNQPKVRAAIERKLATIEKEMAKQTAKAALLGVELVDETLVSQLKRRTERVPAEIIKIGYGRVGLLKDDEFYVAPDPNHNKNAPSIYQRQTIAKRTVTTETEEVTQTETVIPVDPIFETRLY